MKSFTEFESALLGALQQERSDLQGLQAASEAQLSAWVEHLFREYLGYTHWKEISREGSTPVGSKGSKQLFPDLRIEVLDNGLIFVECKRPGRLDGPKGQDELNDAANQLRTYIRAHVDRATVKPKTVLGIVTDGNRWLLMGLNRTNEFHTIAEWAFLTDDPRLIAQRLWLLAKPALAQPTSALVEFLARRTLADVLKDNTKWLTKKVNEKLPDGNVSEEMIAKWLRDSFSDPVVPPRLVPADSSLAADHVPPRTSSLTDKSLIAEPESIVDSPEPVGRRIMLSDLLSAGLLLPQDVLMVEGFEGRRQTATITPDGKINLAGQIFDSVSPAALRALELAGKSRIAVNGWATFRVLRAGNYVGTLLQIRGQYEDREQEESAVGSPQDAGPHGEEGLDTAAPSAVEQIKPLLGLLPELKVNTNKSAISLYAGKLCVGYAYPRKKGLPRIRVYVGDMCPEWATQDPTYGSWCYVDDWSTNLERVITLFKEAPRLRAEDMAAGRDPYRRRTQSPGSTASSSAE
ncbi:MAG TPA: hypothetical protein VKU02_07110 [Gemmataceae bacterium]|nr:hypothetical protein [Gemmataceae bacterium]